jgi:hypothetical protein
MGPEMLSLVGGAVAGFIFKYMAQAAADRQAQFEMMLKQQVANDDSADKAEKRVSSDSKAGMWVRRVIVLAVLFGVIMAPFLLALLNKSVTVEVVTPIKSFLGLWSFGGTTKFYELQSYLLIPEVRQALMAIIGFYFGNSSAKR